MASSAPIAKHSLSITSACGGPIETTVIRSYRIALDAINNGTYTKEMAERLLLEIKKASHRDFTKRL